MNRIFRSSFAICGLTTSVLATISLALTNYKASAQTAPTAPCYAQFQGQTMLYMFDSPLVNCARTIRAAATPGAQWGFGTWGNYQVRIDSNGNTYANPGNAQWQYVGVAVNQSGAVGSLSDRCFNGDVQACNQWQRQSENAIEQMDRMYPPGWFR
ncbi:hypothetical protein IQ238_21550 [Pleurocapsales cyanobacterium LEGE 06147]|nr:hypothetical protein [Pleurocapsales cyanobacterium LEGE 06147]